MDGKRKYLKYLKSYTQKNDDSINILQTNYTSN